MPRYSLGLVVGKFAPLHFGHEWLIQQAARQCERLFILSYTKPEFDRCGVAHRRAWLAARFPAHACLVLDDAWLSATCNDRGISAHPIPWNDATDAVQQTWLAWLLGEVLDYRPDALFCSEDYGPSTAETLSRALNKEVVALLVDKERAHFPISASAIRSSPNLARRWTAPEVSVAFVRRLVLLGGESSGKSTLAVALANALGTVSVAEYGRELWERQGGLDEADLPKIAMEQIVREENAARAASDWLVCDTSPLTTFGYGFWMFGRTDPELRRMAERAYDAIVLCSPDFDFVQDGTRRDERFRLEQHEWYLERVRSGNTPWLVVHGSVDQRVTQVICWLKDKWSSSFHDSATCPLR